MKKEKHTKLKKDKNITETNIGDTVTVGRMKGNIKSGDKIYKISSKIYFVNIFYYF